MFEVPLLDWQATGDGTEPKLVNAIITTNRYVCNIWNNSWKIIQIGIFALNAWKK